MRLYSNPVVPCFADSPSKYIVPLGIDADGDVVMNIDVKVIGGLNVECGGNSPVNECHSCLEMLLVSISPNSTFR